jgi:single-stranded-DNA-specific exonuclease
VITRLPLEVDWIIDCRAAANASAANLDAANSNANSNAANAESSSNSNLDANLDSNSDLPSLPEQALVMAECPSSWDELMPWLQKAAAAHHPLAIAYPSPHFQPPEQIWQQLVGIAKYLSRTGQPVTRQQIRQKLNLRDRTLQAGLDCLKQGGFRVTVVDDQVMIAQTEQTAEIWQTHDFKAALDEFLAIVAEAQFRQRYFAEIPLQTIQAAAQRLVAAQV